MTTLTFYKGDKVRLLNGRIATVINRCSENRYYYHVSSFNDEGKKVYYKVFNFDMRLIKRATATKTNKAKTEVTIIINGGSYKW